MKKRERAAMDAVAKRFSATWEEGSGLFDAWITVAGKTIAVEIVVLKRRGSGRIRLRFDKVVIRLMNDLQSALNDTVPEGITVLLTVTAPIRLASKTAASLEEKIQALLLRRAPSRDVKGTIYGNRIRIRIVRDESGQAPKMIGFVHNADSDPALLLNMTCELVKLIGARADRRTPESAGNRWLVVISAGEVSCLGAYRSIYSELGIGTDFEKIFMVFGDGRIGILKE